MAGCLSESGNGSIRLALSLDRAGSNPVPAALCLSSRGRPHAAPRHSGVDRTKRIAGQCEGDRPALRRDLSDELLEEIVGGLAEDLIGRDHNDRAAKTVARIREQAKEETADTHSSVGERRTMS